VKTVVGANFTAREEADEVAEHGRGADAE